MKISVLYGTFRDGEKPSWQVYYSHRATVFEDACTSPGFQMLSSSNPLNDPKCKVLD